jgi:serine/threonine protein kinase
MREVNLGSRIKRRLRSTSQPGANLKDYSRVLAGIESGIIHLHTLGPVHKDINRSDTMLDGDKAVIIEFGSCRRLGESLEGISHSRYDEQVNTALP